MKGFSKLNKAFESRVRLGVMSLLMVNEWVSYSEMKELLDLTDGNLASHISALDKLGYVEIDKKFVGKKPLTSYQATKLGKVEFKQHIDSLEKLLRGQ
ncbi:MAG: DNA-binding transcriptional ArsR family regulator [Flavobacteriales bacterium]|jgi:DNA-binding transcriptional ArsR family regulator